MTSVDPTRPEEKERLGRKLCSVADAPGIDSYRAVDSFDFQRQWLFPILQRNQAYIYVGWGPDGYVTVAVYDRPEANINEYRFDGDVAACVARALERYWGLEE